MKKLACVMACVVGVGLLAAACSGNDEGAPSNGAPSFGTSACGTCQDDACSAEVASCSAEPDCAAHLTCLRKCPSGTQGNVDAACADECPTPTSSSAKSAFDKLTVCRLTGAGSSCASCGAAESPQVSAILSQSCPAPDQSTSCAGCSEPGAGALCCSCAMCEDQYCCDTYQAYQANPEAIAFRKCWGDCLLSGGSSCDWDCYQQHPDGVKDWAPRQTCLFVHCLTTDTCSDNAPSACATCMTGTCKETYAALNSSPAGYLLFACMGACPNLADEACLGSCKQQFPSALVAFDNFMACMANNCTAVCGVN